MYNYIWTITNLERARNDYITIVHWSCEIILGEGYKAIPIGINGTVSFQQEEGEEIIPFADLTEELVKGWMFEKLNKEEVEASVKAKLDSLLNPPLISGTPW